jgi:hypothetical protein
LFRSEFFFRTTQELEYLFFFVAQSAKFFFQNLTLGYMTKTLNQIFSIWHFGFLSRYVSIEFKYIWSSHLLHFGFLYNVVVGKLLDFFFICDMLIVPVIDGTNYIIAIELEAEPKPLCMINAYMPCRGRKTQHISTANQ